MTLNSEGLEKALPCVFCQGEIFLGEVQKPDGIGGWKKSGYRASCRNCEMSMKEAATEADAIAAWNRRALPPVDGLEVVGHVKPDHPEVVEPLFVRELAQPWMEGIFTIPVVHLSQASSVIAGLKDERDEAKASAFVWENRFVLMDGAYNREISRAQAAEARISSLEEENKRLIALIEEKGSASLIRAARQTLEQING